MGCGGEGGHSWVGETGDLLVCGFTKAGKSMILRSFSRKLQEVSYLLIFSSLLAQRSCELIAYHPHDIASKAE